MGYSFLEFMKRIGIFIICAQSVMHFVAGKSYEKYVKLLIGIMILAQFVVPVRAVLLGGDNAEIWDEVEMFQREMEMVEGNTEIIYEEPEVTELLQEELKVKLEDIAEKYGYSVKEVKVYEEPPEIVIAVLPKSEESNSIGVDKIEIDVNIAEEDKEGKYNDMENAMIAETDDMREEFSICLGTDASYIRIKTE